MSDLREIAKLWCESSDEDRRAKGEKLTRLLDLAEWLRDMDNPESVVGMANRRAVTLTSIIWRAKDALGET